MVCDNCGNVEAYRLSFRDGSCVCNKCGNPPTVTPGDAYFRRPYFDPQIADPDKSPKGTFIESKGHKAALMRQLGIRECGDRVHGSR